MWRTRLKDFHWWNYCCRCHRCCWFDLLLIFFGQFSIVDAISAIDYSKENLDGKVVDNLLAKMIFVRFCLPIAFERLCSSGHPFPSRSNEGRDLVTQANNKSSLFVASAAPNQNASPLKPIIVERKLPIVVDTTLRGLCLRCDNFPSFFIAIIWIVDSFCRRVRFPLFCKT